MANVDLSPRDIDYIGRVVQTEVPGWIAQRNPREYANMVGAVVDTIMNRLETGRYGKNIEDVLNEHRAFSKITGPSRLDPYGSVQNAPKASKSVQAVVNDHIVDRAAGKKSAIGGALDYANPHYSDRKNLRGWVEPMIEAGAKMFGLGKAAHFHGLAPGNFPAAPFTPTVPGGFMPPVDPSVNRFSLEDPLPTINPSPTRPDEFAAAGPLGNFQVGPSALAAAPVAPVERGGPLAPAFTGSIAPAMSYAPSLQAAPTPQVSQGPSLAPPAGVPQAAPPNVAQAYGQMANTMSQAGVTGLGAMPSHSPTPASAAAAYGQMANTLGQAGIPNIGAMPAIAPPQQAAAPLGPPSAVINPIEAPPPVETKSPQSRRSASARDILGGAVRGALGGLPGAVLGAARAASRTQNPGPNQGGLFDSLFGANNAFAPVAPGDRFGFGAGLNSVLDAMSGPRGLTAYGSHPGSTITGLGPGIGYTLTSDKYGWTETYSPDGSFMGISFDGKKDDKDEGESGGLGGFFSGLFD